MPRSAAHLRAAEDAARESQASLVASVTGIMPPFAAGTAYYFATCPRGLEALLCDELAVLGAQGVAEVPGGVKFEGDEAIGQRANLNSRLASRILRKITQLDYRDEHDIYDVAVRIDWPALFDVQCTLRIDVVGRNSPVRSLEFTTLRIKDAVCDRFREVTGERPSIDTAAPDVRLHAFLDETTATLYDDLSGDTLFKRGWRQDKVAAPLRENLAAGMLALAGWTPGMPLLDPFCGSGTIAIEAAHIALGRAAGLSRHFGFEQHNGFDAQGWHAMREAALDRIQEPADLDIRASDISPRAVGITRENIKRARVPLQVATADARTVQPWGEVPGLLIGNPPYGARAQFRNVRVADREHRGPEGFRRAEAELQDDGESLLDDFGPGASPDGATADDFWAEFAANLKRHFAGWRVALISSDLDLPRRMRLKPARKVVLYNGALECRLFIFDIVEGSNRG